MAAVVVIAIVGWTVVGAVVIHRYRREHLAARAAPPKDAAAVKAARDARTQPLVDPAPAPVPTSLPLVGGEGTLPDGYPIAHVDGAALRSLLWHSRFADLDRYFGQLEDAFEADNSACASSPA